MCYRSFLTLSDTYVVMPIVVHEFVKEAVPEEELRKPQQLERRACLFRQRIPPDQLNPQVLSHSHHLGLKKKKPCFSETAESGSSCRITKSINSMTRLH